MPDNTSLVKTAERSQAQVVLQLSAATDILSLPANQRLNVNGWRYIRVYNTAGVAVTASAYSSNVAYPMYREDGVAISIPSGGSQLVAVSGAHDVAFSGTVDYSFVA